MLRTLQVAVALAALCAQSSGLEGGDAIRLQVTPTLSVAPAFLTVRVRVEAAAENRGLQVVAESADFYRSSEVQLEGDRAESLSVFEFRNLPPGTYQITGVLVGANGPRATALKIARVEPQGGR
jgi:hypothetical protein